MRTPQSGNMLELAPIHSYKSWIELRPKRPYFERIIPTRNYHGDSALTLGKVEAVSAAAVQLTNGSVHFIWTPGMHVGSEEDLSGVDDAFKRAYPEAQAGLNPKMVQHSYFNPPTSADTVEALAAHANDQGWQLDFAAANLPKADAYSRYDLFQFGGEELTIAWMEGGYMKVAHVDSAFGQLLDTPDVIANPSGGEGWHPDAGRTPAVVNRNEVWVASTRPWGHVHLHRWVKNEANATFGIADHAGFADEHGWAQWRWWDNSSFRVRAMADGMSRLISYQAGPGQAFVRLYQNGILSDPYPVMFSDKEYSYQYVRLSDVTPPILCNDGVKRHFAVVERGITGSDSLVHTWFTGLAHTVDGIHWSDWTTVAQGRIPGALVLMNGMLVIVSPGQLWAAPGVSLVGKPAVHTLSRVSGWRLSASGGSRAATGETQATVDYQSPKLILPQIGEELRRYYRLGGYTFDFGPEEIDSVSPSWGNAEATLTIQSRGPLKDGIEYHPPVDEIFESGDAVHVGFELQTVVPKHGTWEREVGNSSENGHILVVSSDETVYDEELNEEVPTGRRSVAIHASPVRPGNFWASTRMTAEFSGAGLVFGFVDPQHYTRSADGVWVPRVIKEGQTVPAEEIIDNYYALKLVSATPSDLLQLVQVKDDEEIVLRSGAVSGVAEVGVQFTHGRLWCYVSQPHTKGIAAYTESTGDYHARNTAPNGAAWVPIFDYVLSDWPTVPTYVGVTGPIGSRFRHLHFVEVGQVLTMGRLAEKILRRANLSLVRASDIKLDDQSHVDFCVVHPTAPPFTSYPDGWKLQSSATPWMYRGRLPGFDVELEVDLRQSWYSLELILAAASPEYQVSVGDNLWGQGGIKARLNHGSLEIFRSRIVQIGGNVTTEWVKIDHFEWWGSLSKGKWRLVMYPDPANPQRSVLYVYWNDCFLHAFVLGHQSFGGFIGFSGLGYFRNFVVSGLPYQIGDHVWSYQSSAVDEVKNLVGKFNHVLLERPDGKVALMSATESDGDLGDLPSTYETDTLVSVDEWASVIRVVGAEVWASYADPELIKRGLRTVEVDVPYLWAETQCLNFAKERAELIRAEMTRHSVKGPLDPRITLQSAYKILDRFGTEHRYLVDAYSMTVQHLRQVAGTIKVDLRRQPE